MTIALVDCNNFFVSCERVFRPELRNKPVAVLSSNDGCIIARSNEVKKLGIKMGEPLFKCKNIIKNRKVTLFSSNFELYSTFSQRVMQLLINLNSSIEIYSVDEAFLDFSKISQAKLVQQGSLIQHTILKNLNIPVTIGIAKTKTLAKLASEYGKLKHQNVVWLNKNNQKIIFKELEVSKIWGIGRKFTVKLNSIGIKTCYDFIQQSENWIKNNFSITGLRTFMELKGEVCIPLHCQKNTPKSVFSSRSFSTPLKELNLIKEALANFLAIATKKLRINNLLATNVQVLLSGRSTYDHFQVTLMKPSNINQEIIKSAYYCLRQIYHHGMYYKKVAIHLNGLIPAQYKQLNLLYPEINVEAAKLQKISYLTDQINQQWGKNTIQEASRKSVKFWKPNCNLQSPRYLGSWDNLPVAR